jgi:signal transduction histidine kinase
MKNMLTIAGLLLLITMETQAQPVISTDRLSEAGSWNISGQLDWLEDSVGLRPAAVTVLRDGAWQTTGGVLFFHRNSGAYPYWFRFRVVVPHDAAERSHLLQLSNRGINELELFVEQDGRLVSMGRTGDNYAFSRRAYGSVYFTFPLPPVSDTTTYFLYCDKRNENLNLRIYLFPASELRRLEQRSNVFLGFFGGVLLMALIVSLILLAIFRDRLNLAYTGYILAVGYLLMAYEGVDFQLIFPEHPFYADLTRYVASSVALGMMIFVMQLFCNQREGGSRFLFTANVFKYLAFLTIPVTCIIYIYFPGPGLKKIHFIFFMLIQSGGTLIVFLSCMERVLQRYMPAVYYLSAVTLSLYSGINVMLLELGLIHREGFAPHLMQWCFTSEVVLISAGIIHRFQLVISENRKLSNEMVELKLNSIRQLLATQQEERMRIAGDLHDLTGAQLAVLKLRVDRLPVDAERLREIISMIDTLAESSRSIAHDLRAAALHEYDLSEVVSQHLRRLNETQPIIFQFVQSGTPRDLPEEAELTVYKIIMELVTNILRHSGASEAIVQFTFQDDGLELLVEDDGVGIRQSYKAGLGISNIKHRIERMKGRFHLDTRPGNTTYIIFIPYGS